MAITIHLAAALWPLSGYCSVSGSPFIPSELAISNGTGHSRWELFTGLLVRAWVRWRPVG